MRLTPTHREAWKELFGNPVSVQVVVDLISSPRFNKTHHWNTLFGDKTKEEAIVLLKRIQRAKNYDYEIFKGTFAERFMKPVVDSKIRYGDFMSHD